MFCTRNTFLNALQQRDFCVKRPPKSLKNFRLRWALTPWGARDFSSPVLNREKLVIKVLNRGKLVIKVLNRGKLVIKVLNRIKLENKILKRGKLRNKVLNLEKLRINGKHFPESVS